jgi:chorismate dehydratase
MNKKFVFAGAPYSNQAPLMEKIETISPGSTVLFDYPSNLVRGLLDGKVDAAVIPVAHLFIHPELTMIEGLGIAADGPVRSVLLKCNKPMGQIKTIARDPASATSNALAELLMTKYFKQKIEMYDFQTVEQPDASVVIGDQALCADPARAGDIDLAEAWQKWTKLPFVFAVWAVRKDFEPFEVVSDIAHKSYAAGFMATEQIAERYADKLGRSQNFWVDYLDNSIYYKLGSSDLEGMNRFRTLLAEMLRGK